MTPRSGLVAALATVLLGTSAALAVDASCVGVQGVAAQRIYEGLDAQAQDRYRGVIDGISALQRATAQEIAEPERLMTELLGMPPEAASEQAWQAFYQQLPQSDRMDAAYTASLHAQFRAHWYEALMVAMSSRLPREGADRRVAGLAADYARTQRNSRLLSAVRESSGFQQLVGVGIIAGGLQGRGMTDPRSQAAAADAGALARTSERAQIGFDDLGLPVALVEMAADAALVVAATQAEGQAAELHLAHMQSDLPGAPVRREIMERGRTQAGRETARTAAVSLKRHSEQRVVRERIVRAARPEAPPPQQRQQDRRAWASAVVERGREARGGVVRLPPCLIRAVGGAAACPSAGGASP